MIHPTRTNLLLLKEKVDSVKSSVGILKARRQALIKEFMALTKPLLRSRAAISRHYKSAQQLYHQELGSEGAGVVESAMVATRRTLKCKVVTESLWGISYKSVELDNSPLRSPLERGYDHRLNSLPLEEATQKYELIIRDMVAMAVYEKKLKKLGDEIQKTTRRIRVLEERVLPGINADIKYITQYFSERERESFYSLKMFKKLRTADGTAR